MRRFGTALMLGMALVATGWSVPWLWQEDGGKKPPQPAQISQWIQQLGDTDFEVR